MRRTLWLAAAVIGITACGESAAPTDATLTTSPSLSRGAENGNDTEGARSAAYTLSNSTTGNAVIAFARGSK